MLPEIEEKISYEDYDKFLTLASNLTHFLDKIATKIESRLGE